MSDRICVVDMSAPVFAAPLARECIATVEVAPSEANVASVNQAAHALSFAAVALVLACLMSSIRFVVWAWRGAR